MTQASTTISRNINTEGTLTVIGSSNFTGAIYASSTIQSTGAARFYGTARIDGATTLNTVSYTWPSSDGSASQYLQTNGAGTLSWATVSGGGASADWVKQNNFGVLSLTASTTIPYWAKDAIYASSTLIVQGLTTLTNASTTQLTNSGLSWFTGLTTLGNASTTQISSTGSAYFATTGGNLGIGTTSPGTLLSLGNTGNDTINILATATSTFGSGINLRTGCFSVNGTCVGSGGSGTINSGTIGQLSYYAGDGTTLTATSSLFIHSNQNIGIGTTTPNWLLQAAGTRPFLTLSDTGAGTDNKHWFMSSQGGNFYVGTSSDAYATSTYLTINSVGRVGIGTTQPTQKLNVVGDIDVTSGGLRVGTNYVITSGRSMQAAAGSASAASLTFNADSNTGFFNPSADNLGITVGGSEIMRLTPFGVGIGSSTPNVQLQVATTTANATTTIEVGKASQNKGSCLKLYDTAGTVAYCTVTGTTFSCSATSCE